MVYKNCCVPSCVNNSNRTPDKFFITVPEDEDIRKFWFEAIRQTISHLPTYCCEDHFDLQQDAEYWTHLPIGEPIIHIRPEKVPHKCLTLLNKQKTVLPMQLQKRAAKETSQPNKIKKETVVRRIEIKEEEEIEEFEDFLKVEEGEIVKQEPLDDSDKTREINMIREAVEVTEEVEQHHPTKTKKMIPFIELPNEELIYPVAPNGHERFILPKGSIEPGAVSQNIKLWVFQPPEDEGNFLDQEGHTKQPEQKSRSRKQQFNNRKEYFETLPENRRELNKKSQRRECNHKCCSTSSQKDFALALYTESPSTYKSLQKQFELPSIVCLYKWKHKKDQGKLREIELVDMFNFQ